MKQVPIKQFFSERSSVWQPSAIRGLFPLEQRPGMISFLAGKPNPSTFPFESITMKIKPGVHGQEDAAAGTNGVSQPHEISITGDRLAEALQYGATAGLPGLVKWLEAFQAKVHNRNKESEDWRISLGIGSQDLLSKAFQLLVDDGDPVLMESPAYSYAEGFTRLIASYRDLYRSANARGTLGAIAPNHADLIEVDADNQGLSSDHLRKVLENWEKDRPNQKRPKVLYTIPMGSNPTGASIPESRKIEILQLAKEHNLLIMEDDAYAFLYFGEPSKKARSYFELEPEVNQEVGRVLRFDSFSKILSSGMRLGFATAPREFLDRMDLITANTNLQCPSTTQMMVLGLLEHWGTEGFLEHCHNVAEFYRSKRDMFEAAAKKHLDGVADWVTPVAGMFLYINMHLTTDGSEGDSFSVIREKAVEKGVLAVPGTSFMPSGSKSACVRVSYSLATPEQADEGFRRLREVIDEVRAGK